MENVSDVTRSEGTFKMDAKRSINKFCKKLDERRFYHKTYGKVFVVDLLKICFLIGFIVPVLDYVAMGLIKMKGWNREIWRISVRDD